MRLLIRVLTNRTVSLKPSGRIPIMFLKPNTEIVIVKTVIDHLIMTLLYDVYITTPY